MRIAVLYGPHDFRIEERPRPELKEDECLIRVRACGVCHSELHQWDAYQEGLSYPRLIGHEVAGEVLAVGRSVQNHAVGERVAVWTDSQGYAEEVAVKADRIFPIAPGIPFEYALAEPIACATNAVEKAGVRLGDVAAVVGTGFMGALLLQMLRLKGVSVLIAIDIRDEMLALARRLGADAVLNPSRDAVLPAVRELTQGKGVDVSFEAGGQQATLDLAAEICRMEGKLVIFGYHPGPRHIADLGMWNWMAFDVVNAHFRDLRTILTGATAGMRLLNAGRLDMSPLVTHRYPLAEIEAAFTAAKEKPKGFVKSVIVLEGGTT